MNFFRSNKESFGALLLAFMAMLMLAGCSSSDESSDSSSGGGCETGDKGICCDVDPMQPGCAG